MNKTKIWIFGGIVLAIIAGVFIAAQARLKAQTAPVLGTTVPLRSDSKVLSTVADIVGILGSLGGIFGNVYGTIKNSQSSATDTSVNYDNDLYGSNMDNWA